MSTNENTPLTDETPQGHAMAVPAARLAAPAANPGWSNVPVLVQPDQSKPLDLWVYVHAARRHWVLATSVGVLCAAVLGGIIRWFNPPQYTAIALLHVKPTDDRIMGSRPNDPNAAPTQYEGYKETQARLLASRDVFIAALRDPAVQRQQSIQDQEAKHNTLTWLERELQAVSGKNTELIQVSMKLPDREEGKILVNAIVKAYIDLIGNREFATRKERLDKLQRISATKESEVRDAREKLKGIAENAGTSDRETLSLKEQIAVQQYADFRRELTKLEFELEEANSEVKIQQVLLEGLANVEVSEHEVAAVLATSRMGTNLADALAFKRMAAEMDKGAIVPGNKKIADRQTLGVQAIQSQYDELEKEIRERIRGVKRAEIDKDLRKWQVKAQTLEATRKHLAEEVENQRKAAEQMGKRTVEIEMQRAEVKQLDQVLDSIAQERERLKVELGAVARVENVQAADTPETESGKAIRMSLIVLGMLAGFCLPMVGIVAWDMRYGRINAAGEVSKGLGLPILGGVPMIPANVIRRLGSPTKKHQVWRVRLTESVDGVAARLLRKADREQAHVILVSSATSGEGKTTLATQLAMSLARSLRRTILVDFDLRRPAMDGVFTLPLEPGVCESLRGQVEPAATVHPTATENLSVMTAGRWDRQVLAALANGGARALLEQLRAQYDFVILDSSPILPVADTRFVSQHVDGVILSVFRDVSQAPKVLATCEILEAFGVRSIEAVITGAQEHSYGKSMDYGATDVEAQMPEQGEPEEVAGA